ncbi:MAG: kynurenine 3-monooxygenase [Patiriisocius sp.]|jgi:kynurenine 3-monooxygenase
MNSIDKIIVVGAGLTGPLIAIMMKQRGYDVDLYESRPDMREIEMSAGRSINLALSNRGIKALEEVDCKTAVMALTVPMYGRMLHDLEGNQRMSPYSGRDGEAINSVPRGELNILLMNKAEAIGVKIFFNMKCTSCDLLNGSVTFKSYVDRQEATVHADLILGADGLNSAVRDAMYQEHRKLKFSFSQDYLTHGYKELRIPPGPNNEFQLDNGALHIWPRGGHMIIALPNEDKSFTVTLFHSFNGDEGFDNLNTDDKILIFFKKYYKSAFDLMPDLLEDFKDNPTGSLTTIKCYPWQAYGKTVLIGDSAHAIVPFYGQGMNASFEDCSVFARIHDKHKGDWTVILDKYQEERKVDADAIAELALQNYIEMRDSVAHPDFKEKRELEMKLEATYPDFNSKYSMVTFKPEIPYSTALSLGKKQDQFLLNFCGEIDDTSKVDIASLLKNLKNLHD